MSELKRYDCIAERTGYPLHKVGRKGKWCRADDVDAEIERLKEIIKSFLRAPAVGSDGPGSITLRVMEFNLNKAREATRG